MMIASCGLSDCAAVSRPLRNSPSFEVISTSNWIRRRTRAVSPPSVNAVSRCSRPQVVLGMNYGASVLSHPVGSTG